MKIRKTKEEKRSEAFFYFGVIIGLLGGIVGNLTISAANNILTSNCKSEICLWGSLILTIIGMGIFFGLVIWILNKFNKIVRKLKK